MYLITRRFQRYTKSFFLLNITDILKDFSYQINWKSIFIDYLAVGNVEINPDDDICIWQFKYLKELAKILKDTKPRTIGNNYIIISSFGKISFNLFKI